MKKDTLLRLGRLLVILLGIGILVYPSLSEYLSELNSSRTTASYDDTVSQMEQARLDEMLAQAQEYNRQLAQVSAGQAPQSDEDGNPITPESYWDLLNVDSTGIMGYIEIPKLNTTIPIYHGTDADTLELGIGHLLGSSLPIGGESTHTVLTAHSGMASQKMFSDLNQLEKGDVFYLEVLDETLAYQVEEIHTVLPTNTDNLGITAGEERCTLVTCTPFGVNTHRLLVQGTRIPYEESEAIAAEQMQSKEVRSTWEEEYLNGIITGISVVILLAILVGTAMFFRRELE